MKADQFIKKKLKQLLVDFPTIKCNYGYNGQADIHIVDIVPTSVYKSDRFLQAEELIFDEFIEKFADQSITFVSDDKYLIVEKTNFYGRGLFFNSIIPNIEISVSLNTSKLEKIVETKQNTLMNFNLSLSDIGQIPENILENQNTHNLLAA